LFLSLLNAALSPASAAPEQQQARSTDIGAFSLADPDGSMIGSQSRIPRVRVSRAIGLRPLS
jgi:hypothetical protein